MPARTETTRFPARIPFRAVLLPVACAVFPGPALSRSPGATPPGSGMSAAELGCARIGECAGDRAIRRYAEEIWGIEVE